ncbi:heavy metal translocating P-type ATPase [Anaerovoracaceae bacterium SGI.195]
MKFNIIHRLPGRTRVRLDMAPIAKRLTCEEADAIQYHFENLEGVSQVKVYHRTCDVVVSYNHEIISEKKLLGYIRNYCIDIEAVPEDYFVTSSRKLENECRERLINAVLIRTVMKYFAPPPIGVAVITIRGLRHVWHGIRELRQRKIGVEVLDGAAIGASLLRRDFGTAGSIMFLLGIGEILEEWTEKKSTMDLAKSMALKVDKVWLVAKNSEESDILVPADQVKVGDYVRVGQSGIIPFDGTVVYGDALVSEAAITGEPGGIHKDADKKVYAGTVVDEGELVLKVTENTGGSKYDKIVKMIEESESMKSTSENKAMLWADKLVPYTFLGAIGVWLFTRNITKTMAVLLVDYSCALKLSMPVTMLSAIGEAGKMDMTVKGGRYFEELAQADTVVFDKTGTLTEANPVVREVVTLGGNTSSDELLRIAACLEEHFPHSVARAVVKAAEEKHLKHEELHSQVEYVIAHGIKSTLNGKPVIVGSHHFVFEDERTLFHKGAEEIYNQIPAHYSQLILAIDGVAEAVICVEDRLRNNAPDVINGLKARGIKHIVMLTGDNVKTAEAIASRLGIDEFVGEVLPEFKAEYVRKARKSGRKVIMVGDGINDAPALSEANVGIAVSKGAAIAREIADVIIGKDDIGQLPELIDLSRALMKRVRWNYRIIIGINSALIVGGVAGVISPTTSALIHNGSTLAIGLHSTTANL